MPRHRPCVPRWRGRRTRAPVAQREHPVLGFAAAVVDADRKPNIDSTGVAITEPPTDASGRCRAPAERVRFSAASASQTGTLSARVPGWALSPLVAICGTRAVCEASPAARAHAGMRIAVVQRSMTAARRPGCQTTLGSKSRWSARLPLMLHDTRLGRLPDSRQCRDGLRDDEAIIASEPVDPRVVRVEHPHCVHVGRDEHVRDARSDGRPAEPQFAPRSVRLQERLRLRLRQRASPTVRVNENRGAVVARSILRTSSPSSSRVKPNSSSPSQNSATP
jgi:hypothetical protein